MEGTKAGQRSATGETWQVWLFDNLCQPLITGALGGYFHWVAFGGVVALGGYYVVCNATFYVANFLFCTLVCTL